jgi:hypothetical protein
MSRKLKAQSVCRCVRCAVGPKWGQAVGASGGDADGWFCKMDRTMGRASTYPPLRREGAAVMKRGSATVRRECDTLQYRRTELELHRAQRRRRPVTAGTLATSAHDRGRRVRPERRGGRGARALPFRGTFCCAEL